MALEKIKRLILCEIEKRLTVRAGIYFKVISSPLPLFGFRVCMDQTKNYSLLDQIILVRH